MTVQGNRVLQITRHKCGSQWVRDVLSAPEIVASSCCPHSGVVPHFETTRRLDLPVCTFTGPVYEMNRWEWRYYRRLGDKAVVVLRDPRDAMISLMHSVMYSHASNVGVNLARRLLHSLPHDHVRIFQLIHEFRRSGAPVFYNSWCEGEDEEVLVVRYEDLVMDQHAEFRRIVDWLGWRVPTEDLRSVVERLSFQARSGRKAGESDKYSHYRKGVAGDWKNYFAREHGELWEALFPRFLQNIGYERTNDWWRTLPKRHRLDAISGTADQTTLDGEKDLLTVLENNLIHIQEGLKEKERVIQELLLEKNNTAQPSSDRISTSNLEKELARVHQELEDKERVIQGLLQTMQAVQPPSNIEAPAKGLLHRSVRSLGYLYDKMRIK